jgi:quercetin dioxygenase-like cupin family protein
MADQGQIIENPVSGERITFRETAADTNGELLAIDLELGPDGHVPGMHVHPSQEERFEITDGVMRFRMGREKVIATPGDVVVVPPGVRHKFANAGDERARARVEVRPALRMEELFETTVALARRGTRPAGACRSRSTWRCSCASSRTRCRGLSRRCGSSAPRLRRSRGWRASSAA